MSPQHDALRGLLLPSIGVICLLIIAFGHDAQEEAPVTRVEPVRIGQAPSEGTAPAVPIAPPLGRRARWPAEGAAP